jgi:hypothetical protein
MNLKDMGDRLTFWQYIDNIITYYRLGDIASIIGVIISIVGFGLTLFLVFRSKSAAQQAKDAVLSVKNDIRRVDTIADFSTGLNTMEEIKRLHRQNAWEILPDRYSALRRSLISIRTSNPNMQDSYKQTIQSTIQKLKGIEKQVEMALATGDNPPNVARLNSIITQLVDQLHEILIEIRNEIGRG